jgi:hypothetical protein
MEIDSFSILELLANIFEAWVEHNEHAAQISTFILNGY